MLQTKAETQSPATSAALKVTRLLGDLETYVCGQSDIIIDYVTARRREEPISTAVTEKHSTMAAASPDEHPAADAVDATRCAFAAQGSMRGDEWYSRIRSRRRRRPCLSSFSSRGITPPDLRRSRQCCLEGTRRSACGADQQRAENTMWATPSTAQRSSSVISLRQRWLTVAAFWNTP
jgi:hypothetical protein